MEDKKSYRQIIKTTSLFGGVQIIQILATIIRGKLVALLLGTTGMGINTLYNSVVTMIVQLSTFGLNFSAVRDISNTHDSFQPEEQGKIIRIFKRWMIASAVIGAIIICSGSLLLSRFTFGNDEHSWAFVFLSIAVILLILGSSYITILQGTRRLKEMAKASVFGAVFGLIFCVPFYYFYKERGIVPALIISAFSTFLFGLYFSRGTVNSHPKISFKETITGGTEMAKLGIAMMAANLIGSAVNYVLNSYIGNFGSVADVGLYGAAMSITSQYVGLIFSAMAVDYFPRLSAVSSDKEKVTEMVNQQAEIVLLIIMPVLVGMILTAPLIIRILLSSQFLVITDFISWAAFAMLFKSAAFAMGYISFAKGDKKVFFFFEGVFNSLVTLISSIVGYKYFGLTGIAIAILLSNILYIINVNIVANKRYGFTLSNSLVKIFLRSVLLLGSTLLLALFFPKLYTYTIGSVIFIFSTYLSFMELDKRISLKSLIISRLPFIKKQL